MPSMTVKILKNGNHIVEMNGFTGEMCVDKAKEIMAQLASKGIHVNIENFHRKSDDCPEVLEHVADKAGK